LNATSTPFPSRSVRLVSPLTLAQSVYMTYVKPALSSSAHSTGWPPLVANGAQGAGSGGVGTDGRPCPRASTACVSAHASSAMRVAILGGGRRRQRTRQVSITSGAAGVQQPSCAAPPPRRRSATSAQPAQVMPFSAPCYVATRAAPRPARAKRTDLPTGSTRTSPKTNLAARARQVRALGSQRRSRAGALRASQPPGRGAARRAAAAPGPARWGAARRCLLV
jgi:hypothetical protein